MIQILAAFFFLASGFVANKVLLGFLPPIFFVGIRMLAAGLVMICYSYYSSKTFRFSRIKNDLLPIIGIALFTSYLPSILKAYGLKGLVASKAALIGSCDPFVTSLYAYFLWNEKLTWRKFFGICIGFSGVAYLLFAKSSGQELGTAFSIFSWAELAALGSVFVSRYGWIVVRSFIKKDTYKPVEINGLSMFCSGLLGLTTSCFVDNIAAIQIPSMTYFLGFFIYTIVAGNIIGYGWYVYNLKRYNLTLISLCGFSIPLFVSLLSVLSFGQTLTTTFAVSAAIIFAGLLLFHSDSKI